jgi:plasmid stability protein
MTNLLIRDLDPALEQALKKQANEAGESLSKAAQTLMRRGLLRESARTGLGTEIRNLLPPEHRMDLDIPRSGTPRLPPDFS